MFMNDKYIFFVGIFYVLHFVWISNGYHIELSMNYILLWLAQVVLTALNHMHTDPATEAEEHLTGTCCVMKF